MLNEKARRIFDHIIIIIFAFFSYRLIESFYYDMFYIVANLMEWDINKWVMEKRSFLDSGFCMMALPVFLAWFLLRFKKKKNEFPPQEEKKKFSVNPLKFIPLSVIITFGLGGVTVLWLEFTEQYLGNIDLFSSSMESFEEAWSGLNNEAYIWVLLSVVVLGPIVEELVFRGLIYNYVDEIGSLSATFLVSGIAFGIWHGEPVQSVYTAWMGIVLALVYYRTNSILYPIFIHVLNNFLSALPPGWESNTVLTGIDIVSKLMILPTLIILVIIYNQSVQLHKESIGCKTEEMPKTPEIGR